MFLCVRTRCRQRCFPDPDLVDIKDFKDNFEVHYILNCGHTLCEKCLYLTAQSEERFYVCDQCGIQTNLSARAYTSIRDQRLSTSSTLNRLNEGCSKEIPIDAYSFGMAFQHGKIQASPVDQTICEETPQTSPVQVFKYKQETEDQENIQLKTHIPVARRNRVLPLVNTMHKALQTHAECGQSLKVLGNLEKKLAKEFYSAKMRIRGKFQLLHAQLQMEELKGISKLEEKYKNRKEEFAQVERSLLSLRSQIGTIFEQEHEELDELAKKRNALKEAIAKPSRINWRDYDVGEEFNFELDDYVSSVIKGCLHIPNKDRATMLTLDVIESEVKVFRDSLPLYRSPVEETKPLTPTLNGASNGTLSTSHIGWHSIGGESEVTSLHCASISYFKTQKVKLGRVFSPGYFYVVRWEEPDKINIMIKLMDDWCSKTQTSPPPLGSIKKGSNVFVYSASVREWARGRLLAIFDDVPQSRRKSRDVSTVPGYSQHAMITVDVELLDFGGVERLPYSRIRTAYEELFDLEIYPKLAIKCAIYRIAPRTDEWTEEDTSCIHEFCRNKVVQIKVHEVIGDLYMVDIYQHEDQHVAYNMNGIRTAMCLSRHAIALVGDSPARVARDVRIRYPDPVKLDHHKTESVLITHIQSPDLFYVTRYSEQDKFHEMHEKMKMYFELPEESYAVLQAQVTLPCIILDDGQFYRVIIEKLLPDDRATVRFVDFGTTKDTQISYLRLIRNEFLRIPIQAIPCKLVDIAPNRGFKWSDESINKFHELCFGNPNESYIFNLSVVDYEDNGKHVVNLRRFTGVEYVSLNVTMVQLGCALSSGPLTEASSDTMMLSQYYETKLDDRIFLAMEEFDVCGYNILKEIVARNVEAQSSKTDSFIKIRISHWKSPEEFYIQITSPDVRSYFVCYENKLADDFFKKLDDPVRKIQRKLDTNETVVYVVVDGLSKTWKRGIIRERLAGRQKIAEKIVEKGGLVGKIKIDMDKPETEYRVFARDFGFEVTIPRKHIFKLPADSPFLKDGDFCIRCHLSDLSPAGGGGWTQTALELFEESIKKYQSDLYAFVESKDLDDELGERGLGLDIIGRETVIPSAMAPTRVRYNSFKKILVIRGYALPKRIMNISDDDEPDSDEEVRKKGLIPYTSRNDCSVLSYIRAARLAAQKRSDSSRPVFYREPENPSDNFVGIPTEVEPNLKIWFRVYHIDKVQPINLINRTISNTLKDQNELMPFTGEPLHGRACSAFFEFDQTWNRAEILYSPNNETFFVRFVDYGNEIFVEKKHLSSQVFHHEIPKLALYGYLSDCYSEAKSQEALNLRDLIHETVVDKRCVFVWRNFHSTREMKIDIILPNGQQLRDVLIERTLVKFNKESSLEMPPRLLNAIESCNLCGFKPSSIKFIKDNFYPVMVTGTFRDNYSLIQAKPIENPCNEVEKQICNKYNDFLEAMQTLRAEVSTFDSPEEFKPGDAVAAQFSDLKWYRGSVIEIVENIYGEECRIYFVDYGNTSIIEKEKIRKLPKKFIQSPELFAMPVRVVGVKPKDRVWTSYVSDSMEREVTENENSTLALIKNSTCPWEVELFIARHETPRQPERSLWEPLFTNRMLIPDGCLRPGQNVHSTSNNSES